MNRRSLQILCLLTSLMVGLSLASGQETATAEKEIATQETPEQRDERMKWWREARFGMFVHWGLYSGLAGTWEGEMVGKRGGMEWLQNRVGASTEEYAKHAKPLFKPSKDFAKHWAKLAKQAGCKYLVFTTKHHDGFSLHDASNTTFDAKDFVDRDLCKEIVEACKAEGLKVGFYHSVIDWHHPHYDFVAAKALPYPARKKAKREGRDHKQYVDYLHEQVEELMTNYGTVDIVWWDYSKGEAQGTFWRSEEMLNLVRKHQPNILSNNRLYKMKATMKEANKRLATFDPKLGDFTTPEQHVPSTGIKGVDWEVCMTMNTTWGYSDHDVAWKSNKTLIHKLIDISSKGGNFLLNIGPKGDGSIPEPSVKSMAAIGAWMDVNSESIYGTKASPFEKPKWGRYTTKDGKLYAHVFNWPTDGKLKIASGERKFSRAYLLADKDKQLVIKQEADGLIVDLPEQAPDAIASVIVLEP